MFRHGLRSTEAIERRRKMTAEIGEGDGSCSILYRNSQQTHDYDGIVGGCDPNTPSENVARGDTQLVRGR